MLRHRLPRHVHTDAQFRQRLTVVRIEAIEQHPSAAISEGFENAVGIALQADDDVQVNTCMSINLGKGIGGLAECGSGDQSQKSAFLPSRGAWASQRYDARLLWS